MYVSHRARARGKVADHQVELIDPELLRLRHHRQGLVGGEHHRQTLGTLAVRHLIGKALWIGGDRDGYVVDVVVLDGARDLGVRADREGPQVQLGLSSPSSQRLAQQGDRRNQEEDARRAAIVGGGAFSDLECGEGLAGAAGHDQLAALVAGGEPAEHRVDGLFLMRSRLVFQRRR